MTVDTKPQEASTLTTPDTGAVSGSAQGNNVITLMPLCTKTSYQFFYLCMHTAKSTKCENESTTKSGNSELTGQIQAKQGTQSHTFN